jgi:hypothetical protein
MNIKPIPSLGINSKKNLMYMFQSSPPLFIERSRNESTHTTQVANAALTPHQQKTLHAVAHQQPVATGTDAVFAARAMLGIDVNDENTETNQAKPNTPNQLLRIYPIPAQNVVYIQLDASYTRTTQLTAVLYNALGNVVHTQPLRLTDNTLQLSTQHVASGVYQCKVFDGTNPIGTGKIIVIK